jgi:riboflavin transporter FmnP
MQEKAHYLLDSQSLIAGVIGVLISLFYRRQKTWKTALIGFVTGSAAVWFAAPPLNIWLDSPPQTASLISFILGLCAVKLTESIVKDPFGVLNFLRATVQGEKAEKPDEKEK